MAIKLKALQRSSRRIFGLGLFIIAGAAVLEATGTTGVVAIDPAQLGNETLFGLAARAGGAVALAGLLGMALFKPRNGKPVLPEQAAGQTESDAAKRSPARIKREQHTQRRPRPQPLGQRIEHTA